MVDALLLVDLVLGVEEVEAVLGEQLLRAVGEYAAHALFHKLELAVHRVPRNELCTKAGEGYYSISCFNIIHATLEINSEVQFGIMHFSQDLPIRSQ